MRARVTAPVLLRGFLLCVLLAVLPATAAEPRLFWQAESPAGTVWLLGSLHFGDPSMYPLPSTITAALADAEVLVVEVDITAHAPEAVAEAISRRGLYHDGRRLGDVVDAGTWQSLATIAGDLGVPLPLLERQKPWFATMTLTTLALSRAGFPGDLGIDMHMMALAAEQGIPIVELESIAFQLELLDGLSADAQALMLEQTLEQLTDTEHHFRRLLEAWQGGDADALAGILVEELRGPGADDELYRALLIERNATMTRDIVALLERHDAVFVVVGAGHMVGEDGIVAGLAERGFRIDQPGLRSDPPPRP